MRYTLRHLSIGSKQSSTKQDGVTKRGVPIMALHKAPLCESSFVLEYFHGYMMMFRFVGPCVLLVLVTDAAYFMLFLISTVAKS